MCSLRFKLIMASPNKRVPSLEDALKQGFSELKIGEQNLQPPKQPDASLPQEADAQSQTIQYNQKYEAIEDREEFVVPSPLHSPSSSKSEPAAQPNTTKVVHEASSAIGDDFDVEW
jgi:hypothetical protein